MPPNSDVVSKEYRNREMKVNEIVDSRLDEGWKEKAAALGLAGALGVGGAAYNYITNPENQPEIVKQLLNKTGLSKKKDAAEPANAPVVDKIKKPTVADIVKALPGPAQLLATYAIKAGIEGEELAQLMAQAAHESLNFKKLTEIGSKNYFKQYDPKYNPRKAKILGNTKVGDGERYKGRGYLQITGRWNYTAAGKALGLPLAEQPELLEDPSVAAKVSLWYWEKRVRPKVTDFSDVTAVTKTINTGLKGLDDREQKFNYFSEKLP